MKKQVIVIHGGDTFDKYEEYLSFLSNFKIESLNFFKSENWKDFLSENLGGEFEVIAPRMPNPKNARYLEWKIWFDKIVKLLNNEIVLVGHSLGGTFLAKYLAENDLSKKVVGLHLVAAQFDAEGTDYSMTDFVLPSNLEDISRQSDKIFLYQSKDDTVVPFPNVEKFKFALSESKMVIFENRGHFNQSEFPELVENIINS